MKHKLLTATIVAILSTPAFADGVVRGTVRDVYRTVNSNVPHTVQVCRDVEVSSGGNHSGAIVGGLIGGAVGSQFGKGEGRTAMTGIGAITGAIIGGENDEPAGRRIEQRCSMETQYTRSNKQVYSHSVITFWEAGTEYSIRFQK